MGSTTQETSRWDFADGTGYRLMALRRIYIPKANVVGTSQLFLPATQ